MESGTQFNTRIPVWYWAIVNDITRSMKMYTPWLLAPTWVTHRGRVTYIYVNKLINIGSDNGLSPGRRQAIIWTNAGILLIRPLGTNFREILIEI